MYLYINIAKSVNIDGTCKSWNTANIRFIGVVKIKNPNAATPQVL